MYSSIVVYILRFVCRELVNIRKIIKEIDFINYDYYFEIEYNTTTIIE